MPRPASHRQTRAVEPDRASIEELLRRMRAGDREAAAEFFMRYERPIRRRLRARIGAAARRIYDTDDLFLTIARRFDEIVLATRLRAETVDQLWALLGTMARRCTADQAGMVARESRAAEVAARRRRLPSDPAGIAAERDRARLACGRLARRVNPGDFQVVAMRAAERVYAEIAARLGMTVGAARKRLERVRRSMTARPAGR